MPPIPEPHGPAEGAVVGTFVVGDGTLVGQPPQPPFNKAALILKGGAFVTSIFVGQFEIATITERPKLTLKAKVATTTDESNVVMGKAKLLLNGVPYLTLVPDFAHMGKGKLLLTGKPVALGISGIATVGKGKLILKGKLYHAGEVVLTPAIPQDVLLFPTDRESLVLAAAVPQSLDLVPTVPEFR